MEWSTLHNYRSHPALLVQVLDVAASVGSPLSLPLEACISGGDAAVDALACTDILHFATWALNRSGSTSA